MARRLACLRSNRWTRVIPAIHADARNTSRDPARARRGWRRRLAPLRLPWTESNRGGHAAVRGHDVAPHVRVHSGARDADRAVARHRASAVEALAEPMAERGLLVVAEPRGLSR